MNRSGFAPAPILTSKEMVMKKEYPLHPLVQTFTSMRELLGITKAEVCRRAGIGALGNLTRCERGDHRPTLHYIERLFRAIDYEVVYSLKPIEEDHPPEESHSGDGEE